MIKIIIVALCFLISSFSFALDSSNKDEKNNDAQVLYAGLSRVNITPPIGVPLGGYGGAGRRLAFPDILNLLPYSFYLKPSVGIDDPIHAKTLLLKKGNQQILFISLDVVGVTADVKADLMKLLRPLGFNPEEVLISATHTHSGPGGLTRNLLFQVIAMDRFLEDIYREMLSKIVEGVFKAYNALTPAQLKETSFETSNLQLNRRHEGDYVDSNANLLLIEKKGSFWSRTEVLGGILNYAVHGTAMDPHDLRYSGDIPAALATTTETVLREQGSVDPVILFLNAAEGDVAPKAEGKNQVLESANDFKIMLQKGLSSLQSVEPTLQMKNLNLKIGTPRLAIRSCIGLGKYFSKTFSPIVKINLGSLLPKKTELTAIRLGHLMFLSWPGEATASLGKELKVQVQAVYGQNTKPWVLGLTNDHLGYFTNPDEYSRGGYEACMSFYGKNIGDKIIKLHLNLLQSSD